MDTDDLSSESSDEDYIPAEQEGLSEEDDSGDEEDFMLDETDAGKEKTVAKKSMKNSRSKTKAEKSQVISRKRKGGIRLEDESISNTERCRSADESVAPVFVQSTEERERALEEKRALDEKMKADRLWSDFMSDMSTSKSQRPKPSTCSSDNVNSSASSAGSTAMVRTTASLAINEKIPQKINIVKEFNFAGETVKMVTTVSSDSKEAKEELLKPKTNDTKRPAIITSDLSTLSSATTSSGTKRPAVGGLSSVLGKIGKMPKMSTLVKSKLDWDGFKNAEGIDDELKIHNRGKSGYLERQAFLERTDHRQFEIEKSLRLGSKPT